MSITEKDFYHLTVSINKALNAMEAPLKLKHARSAIIMTHRTKETKSFWRVVTRQPLMENRFTAWKFCHLLHKVLREGHQSSLRHSQSHKKMILEMGKLWGHLQDGVGNCIQAYTKLLVTKLNFHEKNAIFPGSLVLDFADVERFANKDLNVYFQLGVEVFDYLDDIIDLQTRIFHSINTYRMSSMTPQGQCRLAPLITLIQDSNPLYDICVRLMFKLHDELPTDILMGHRDRFKDLFSKLKNFYELVRPLQYFADLIQVPHLPETAPNFTSKVDFGSYIPPVVLVPEPEPEPEPEPVMENIVDTSVLNDSPTTLQNEEIVALENCITNQNLAIEQLHSEITMVKRNYDAMENNYRREILQLQEKSAAISNDLASTKEMYSNMRILKDDLELKLANTPTLIQKANEEEEKAKASSEKFTKLKTMYTQIRDEHINLLRTQSDSTKLLNKERQVSAELSSQIQTLQKQLNDFNEKEQQLTTENAEMISKIDELENRHIEMLSAKNDINEQYKSMETNKVREIEQLKSEKYQLEEKLKELDVLKLKFVEAEEKLRVTETALNEKQEEISSQTNKYKCDWETLNSEVAAKLSAAEEAVKQKEELIASQKNKYVNDLEILKSELETTMSAAEKSLEEKEIEFVSQKTKYELELKALNDEVIDLKKHHDTEIVLKNMNNEEVKEKLVKAESIIEQKEANIVQLLEQVSSTETKKNNLEEKITEIDSQLQTAITQNKNLQNLKTELEIKNRTTISSISEAILKSLEHICATKLDESDSKTTLEKIPLTIEEVRSLMDALSLSHENCIAGENELYDELLRNAVLLGYKYTMLYDQCDLIYKSTTDIEKGQEIHNKVNSTCEPLLKLFELIRNGGGIEKIEMYKKIIETKLSDINQLINALLNTFQTSIDLDELVQNELKEMDAAIEEAASKISELLSSARQKDNGIKLEVNEKILDACTNLMAFIKQLIQKSRLLQQEIVSIGRGNASVKEFYKRNSQWSEGLISASKSVAKGANLLVDAANKAITSESSKNFELIVAAQEIAACTAQLVIASKVKAPSGSQKLSDLTKASRNVSQATGAVVATVKDCNQHLEQSLDMDLTKLTSSQVKTMEMEIHVKVLELEQALQTERMKLSSFRRKHYQNTED